ncbi:MAG: hypothetical protein Kow0092_05330 [Deferrisomatales bacterium]
MPRMPRLLWTGTPSVYHVVSRTALPGFPLGDVERKRLLEILREMSRVYFAEVLGVCLMGNHFHLLVRMHPGEGYADDEIRREILSNVVDGAIRRRLCPRRGRCEFRLGTGPG